MVKIPIAKKLILSLLVVITLTSVIYIGVSIHLINAQVVEQAQEKVRNDLNSAREIYLNTMKNINNIVHLTADSFYLKDAILSGNKKLIATKLIRVKEKEGLDILTLTDHRGKVILRANNISLSGDDQNTDELVKSVLSGKEPLPSTSIVSEEELKKESVSLCRKAYFKFIPTPKERFRKETEEKAGMMLRAAAPVFDYKNNLIGILHGGVLLNRNYDIVDKIKQTVYQNIKYKGKDMGTATIFQDDLRISTNVLNEDGSRAIGTRVTEDVYNQVVLKGKPWIGRAYVVNNWYLTAYEPITNINQKIIGILYVGILEQKFVDIKRHNILIFLGVTCIGLIVSMILSYLLSRNTTKSIHQLVSASKQMAVGNLDTQVRVKSNDELRELADTFNSMASTLKKRDDELKEFTKKRIMESERLAIIGQLSANVAHEINNPIQGVITYSYLLLENMSNGDPHKESLEKIAKQATRCRDIVRGLLDFSRQTQPIMKLSDINSVLQESISLVENQALFHNIEIIKNLAGNLPFTVVDPAQLQQVFMNMIINAAEAMAGKGTLTLTTRMDLLENLLEISFTDTGHGISEKDIDNIFDPFYTTKETGHGTGLGLAISYGIIKKHNGTIDVESSVGKGATFFVRLPIKEK